MAGPTRPDLVIFDCDGVLVDSEPISLDVLLGVLRDAGAPISTETGYRQMLGKSLASNIAWVEDTFRISVSEPLIESLRERLFARFRQELRPVEGVATAIEALGLPVCVASSSQPERIALSLELTGLRPLFGPNVFSATMVARGKPAPDLFLFAAERMGVRPANLSGDRGQPGRHSGGQSGRHGCFRFHRGQSCQTRGSARSGCKSEARRHH